jgi:hypothetical protein
MLRYRLRTLLIVLALGPALLAGAWQVAWAGYDHWRWRYAIDLCGHGQRVGITVLADGTVIDNDRIILKEIKRQSKDIENGSRTRRYQIPSSNT